MVAVLKLPLRLSIVSDAPPVQLCILDRTRFPRYREILNRRETANSPSAFTAMTRSGKETAARGEAREPPADSRDHAPINGDASIADSAPTTVSSVASNIDEPITRNAIRESLRFTSSTSATETPQRTTPEQLRKFHQQIEEITRIRQMLHLDTQPESWAQPALVPPVNYPFSYSSIALGMGFYSHNQLTTLHHGWLPPRLSDRWLASECDYLVTFAGLYHSHLVSRVPH